MTTTAVPAAQRATHRGSGRRRPMALISRNTTSSTAEYVSIEPAHSSTPPATVQPHERRSRPRWAASAASPSTVANTASAEVATYSTTPGLRHHSATARRPARSPSSSRLSAPVAATPSAPAATVATAAAGKPQRPADRRGGHGDHSGGHRQRDRQRHRRPGPRDHRVREDVEREAVVPGLARHAERDPPPVAQPQPAERAADHHHAAGKPRRPREARRGGRRGLLLSGDPGLCPHGPNRMAPLGAYGPTVAGS